MKKILTLIGNVPLQRKNEDYFNMTFDAEKLFAKIDLSSS